MQEEFRGFQSTAVNIGQEQRSSRSEQCRNPNYDQGAVVFPPDIESAPVVTAGALDEKPASQPIAQHTSRPRRAPAHIQLHRSAHRAIAERVHDRSRSKRLEHKLRRQEANTPDPLQTISRRPTQLNFLAIAQRPDHGYQLVFKGTRQTVTQLIFETLEHCAEAAGELEQRFDMGRFLDSPTGETLEGIEAIAREHQWREIVGRSLK